MGVEVQVEEVEEVEKQGNERDRRREDVLRGEEEEESG